jgi:aminoglycoside 6-adenylyltransferase
MRSEREMLELIMDTARNDERIRAVIMNGSRANPNAPRDPFQDFDVVYVVTDIAPFKNNPEWVKRFGELMIMQMPDAMQDPPPESDGVIEPFPPPSENDYLPRPPAAKAFADCCNEFWWVCPYVAKGLWREEILYAKHILDHFVRDQLMKMITWRVGFRTGFSRNLGKFGKNLQGHLEPELWEMLQRTYSDAGYEHTWGALFTACDLFRRMALEVAEHFGFAYPHEDDAHVSAHLKHVRCLSQDAEEMY